MRRRTRLTLQAWRDLYERGAVAGSDLLAERLKVIPYIVEGPAMLKAVINNQVGQISEAVATRQHHGAGYLEVDIDVDEFKVASVFTRLAKARAAPQPRATHRPTSPSPSAPILRAS